MPTTIWDSILAGETVEKTGLESTPRVLAGHALGGRESAIVRQGVEEVAAAEASVQAVGGRQETPAEAAPEQKQLEKMEKEQIAELEAELEAATLGSVTEDEKTLETGSEIKTAAEKNIETSAEINNLQKSSILTADRIDFPYLYKFPGQEKSEEILYATREAKIVLQMRRSAAVLVSVLIIAMVWGIGAWVGANWLSQTLWVTLAWLLTVIILVIMFIAWQWMTLTWKKTIGLLTTYRLIKLVQISPFTNRNQMLPLKEVVDTSSGTRNFWDLIFSLSTFSARSSAASSGIATNDAAEGKLRVNKKYFYWENMENAEDFEHYLHKVMRTLEEKGPGGMHNFRPFAPKLKANHRDEFIKEKYPHYWS